MSMKVNNDGNISKSGNIPDSTYIENFEFKDVQIGSIFLKRNDNGKISLNRTTGKLAEFISQHTDNVENWTKDAYYSVINYLHKNKNQIKEDSINEVINSFQSKANDKNQIANVKNDGEWTITEFTDGTSMKENKNENKVRYYDSLGRWTAGTNNNGVNYLNSYINDENMTYTYISEEIGNNNLFYYSKDDKLIMTDDGKEKVLYITNSYGKLEKVELYNSKTGELKLIGYADENEQVANVEYINNV